jgi:hypothetical protein
VKGWLGLFVLVLAAPPHAAAIQDVERRVSQTAAPADAFQAWVSLYDPLLISWLENENRIDVLCADASDPYACREEMLGPAVTVYDLRRAPDVAAPTLGELIVVAVPGRPLSARFRASGSTGTVSFQPDLYLADWGYGPYFHHTFVARDGDWFRLPRGPWKEAVWIRRPSDGGSSAVLVIQAGDAIEMDGTGWTVLGTEPSAMLLRPEQPADFWCGEGEPPEAEPGEARRYTRAELSDESGHLKFRLKYLKGC